MTDINMTFEDYVKLIQRKKHCERDIAEEEAKDVFEHYLQPYYEFEESITLLNETEKSRQELIEKMHKSVHIKR